MLIFSYLNMWPMIGRIVKLQGTQKGQLGANVLSQLE